MDFSLNDDTEEIQKYQFNRTCYALATTKLLEGIVTYPLEVLKVNRQLSLQSYKTILNELSTTKQQLLGLYRGLSLYAVISAISVPLKGLAYSRAREAFSADVERVGIYRQSFAWTTSSAVGFAATNFLEAMRMRLMSDPLRVQFPKVSDALVQVKETLGTRSFFIGFQTSVIREYVKILNYVVSHEKIQPFLEKKLNLQKNSHISIIVSALAGSSVFSALITPIDAIRTRLYVLSESATKPQSLIKDLFKAARAKGFGYGFTPIFISSVSSNIALAYCNSYWRVTSY